ncbi:MAG: ABC transporter permease [Lautropia sp.]|nr:ABC transporter permease [Lautropia sp.]
MDGFLALFRKELLRFVKVGFQTVAAPVLSALLYLLIFSHALSGRVEVYPGIAYASFLVPGLVMMALLQNAFANSSSSLIQSKVTGNLVFVLLAPLSPWAMYGGYVLSALVRGLVVGLGVLLVTVFFQGLTLEQPLWALIFAILGAGIMGTLGLLAGIWAEKFDQIAAFQNFLIMPLTFLSGVFYSVHSLPPFWQAASHFNPFFYMVDGFRYGFFGQADVDPWLSLGIVSVAWSLLAVLAMRLLHRGYRLRY